jgi:hypothetical protein
MQISFNPSAFIYNDLTKSKVDFINKYGNFSNNYNELTPLGEQKKIWFYFVAFLSLVLSIICFALSSNSNDFIKNPMLKKIVKISAWIFLFIFIASIIYSGYMYLFVYSPQYNEWFKNLPVDAQNKISSINALNMIVNEAANVNRNRNNTSLINIS